MKQYRKTDKRIFVIVLIFFCSFCQAQDYRQYFLNKVVADSLVRLGRYQDALPNIRKCVSVQEMATITDEFYLGYAYFKTEINSRKEDGSTVSGY